MDAKKAQRKLEQRGWAGVPHRPSLRELRESEEM
jgi:hypothetical protein